MCGGVGRDPVAGVCELVGRVVWGYWRDGWGSGGVSVVWGSQQVEVCVEGLGA